MKIFLSFLIGVAALGLATVSTLAQTAPSISGGALQIAKAVYDDGGIVGFYGQKMTDPKTHAAGGLYYYRFTDSTNGPNAYVAMGFDHLWSTRTGAAPANYTISGGFNLDTADYYPADLFGVTNSWLNKISVKGFGTMLAGTPTGSQSTELMNVERVGFYTTVHDWTVFNTFSVEPDLGIAWGSRSGVNPTYDGQWWNVFAAVSIHGKKP